MGTLPYLAINFSVTPVQNSSGSATNKWSVVKKGNNLVSYVNGNEILTLVPEGTPNMEQNFYTETASTDDDGLPGTGRRMRRVACTCPNCRDPNRKYETLLYK